MPEYFESRSTADLRPLEYLIAPEVDRTHLQLDLTDQFLFYESRQHFDEAIKRSGVAFTRAETKAVTEKIDAERKRQAGWRNGVLEADLTFFADGSTLPKGALVAMYQMDRPFLITDGLVAGSVGSEPLPFNAVNGGTPGDYIVVNLKDLTSVVRVAKEWAEKNIRKR